jgi:tRNA(Arg) A34 adenosine deaminase TadA
VGAVQAKGITIPVHGDTATGRKMNERFLREAIELAFEGMRAGQGGPFGAVIVRDGEIIGRGCNRVTSTNDPTAHAEIVAIREACQNAAHFHLPGAVLYASCEPCPMCLAAIYWAGIQTVYYSADRNDAERIGFGDRFVYDELGLPPEARSGTMERMELPEARDLFEEWDRDGKKVMY